MLAFYLSEYSIFYFVYLDKKHIISHIDTEIIEKMVVYPILIPFHTCM